MNKLISTLICVALALMYKTSEATTVNVSGGGATFNGLPATYPDLQTALNVLNGVTFSGGSIIFTMTGNEPVPAGGYVINFTGTTSATNNVIIDGAGYTVTTSAVLTVGSVNDAVFKIIGSDWVTIKNFFMVENGSNTTTGGATPDNATTGNNMTEWGVALLRASTSDGAQNNSIINNDIQLNKSYANTFGIYSNVRHSATAVVGSLSDPANAIAAPNHNNKIYSNTIHEVNMGICFIGSGVDLRSDVGTDIGGTSSTTGNTVKDWGSSTTQTTPYLGMWATAEYVGIYCRSQKGENISWNTVKDATFTGTAANIRPIHRAYAPGTFTGTTAFTISNNSIINIEDNLPNGTNATNSLEGILVEHLVGSNIKISNNSIEDLTVVTASSTRVIRGISIIANGNNIELGNNIIRNFASPGDIHGISNASTALTTLNILANEIAGLISSGATANGMNFGDNGASSVTTVNVQNNMIGDIDGEINPSTPAVSTTGIRIISPYTSSTFNINYNTIYLNASSASASANTAAIFLVGNATSTTSKALLRNNILVDNSTPGSNSGTRSVAIWRSLATLSNYDASLNNNVLFAGMPGSKHLIYWDGTTARQSLANYWTALGVGSTADISELPVFTSNVIGNADYLHLDPNDATNICKIFRKGLNSIILLPNDFDDNAGVIRMTVTPYITDIGADQVTQDLVWNGSMSDDWHEAANWTPPSVPTSNMNVYVATTGGYIPTITGVTGSVNDIVLQTGMAPLLKNYGRLQIAGTITGDPGCITNIAGSVITGSIEMNGVCVPQTLGGNHFANNAVLDFTVSNPNNVTSSQRLCVFGELGFGAIISPAIPPPAVSNSTLYTSDNLELMSTPTRTANVAELVLVDANDISGLVTVERYINTGTGHAKAWQLLATPTGGGATPGQTINASWQEGNGPLGNSNTGYGTIIPGPGAGNGFDIIISPPPAQQSMQSYNYATDDYTGIANTTSTYLYNKQGWFIIVRGDRSVTTGAATPTTMRSKGELHTLINTPPPTTVVASFRESVGNPYASPINIPHMIANNFTNLDAAVTVWDPTLPGSNNLGVFQTLTAASGYLATVSGSGIYSTTPGFGFENIQSGQAFFVHSSTMSGGANGTVTFDETCKSTVDILVTRPAPNAPKDRKLFRAGLFTDKGAACDGTITVFDNAFSNEINKDDAHKVNNPGENLMMTRGKRMFAVEARSEIKQSDFILYTFSNLVKQTYQLRFEPINIEKDLHATLIDNYLGTTSKLSLTEGTIISFNVDDNDKSYADRFVVVFDRSDKQTPAQNPAFAANDQIKAATGTVAGNESSISVYPNPVENKQLDIRFFNQPAGNYRLQLISNNGQVVHTQTLTVNGKNTSASVNLPKSLVAGNYQLLITGFEGNKLQQQVFIK